MIEYLPSIVLTIGLALFAGRYIQLKCYDEKMKNEQKD